jgi:hypothetical protein
MPASVNVETVHPRKLAAVRREVPAGAVGAAQDRPWVRFGPSSQPARPVDQRPPHFSLPPLGSAGRADTVRLRCRGHAHI